MPDLESYIPLIVQSLQEVDPYRIYLFGSLVSGNITDNSDIDIAVILDSEKTHETYDDKIKTRVRVRKSIMDISRQVPIDILVWSKPEFQTLKEINPGFVREIEKGGKIIYEKHYQGMARGSDIRQSGLVSKQNLRIN
jgi:predicted nucleotidyltransferase